MWAILVNIVEIIVRADGPNDLDKILRSKFS